MRINKGVKATSNGYTISGFALVDGKAVSFEDYSETRDKRADTKRIAEHMGVKPSAVMFSYTTDKQAISIACTMSELKELLAHNGIEFTEE